MIEKAPLKPLDLLIYLDKSNYNGLVIDKIFKR